MCYGVLQWIKFYNNKIKFYINRLKFHNNRIKSYFKRTKFYFLRIKSNDKLIKFNGKPCIFQLSVVFYTVKPVNKDSHLVETRVQGPKPKISRM